MQELLVRLEMVGDLAPQYLQVYWDFSEPSYSICLPLLAPKGCLGHELEVRLDTVGDLAPPYLQ